MSFVPDRALLPVVKFQIGLVPKYLQASKLRVRYEAVLHLRIRNLDHKGIEVDIIIETIPSSYRRGL